MAIMFRPRFQFRLSTLLWFTLAVACWFGGVRFGQWNGRQRALKAPKAPVRNPNARWIDRPPAPLPQEWRN